MWAAIHDHRGGGTHQCTFSQSHVQYPAKLWTETVNRLWRLRRQHWQQTSLSSPLHRHPSQSLEHHPHQHIHTDRSDRQHPHPRLYQHSDPHLCPHTQHLYHPQISPRHSLTHLQSPRHQVQRHPSSRHYESHQDRPLQHSFPHHDENQHPPGKARQKRHQQPPRLAKSRLPHPFVADKDKGRIRTTAPYGACKMSGLQLLDCAKPIQSATTLVEQDCEDQGVVPHQKGIKRSSTGLVKESDSKALCHMVNKHVESYVHELKEPSSTNGCKDFDFLKPSSLIHAGSLYHFKPPNLGQRDFEEWMRKHRRKKMSKSGCGSNIAFGRSISSQRRKSATFVTKTDPKNDTSFMKCMRGKLSKS